MYQLSMWIAAALSIATIVMGGSANATPIVFSDNFDRPDGPVGNGWAIAPGGTAGEPSIQNNRVATSVMSGGSTGIYRPIDLAFPITVSATLTPTNGFGGFNSINRYEHTVLIGSEGGIGTGYGLGIWRTDASFSNSRVQRKLNGVFLDEALADFQFGAFIDLSFTVAADGSIEGVVGDDNHSFSFSFTSMVVTMPGPNVLFSINDPAAGDTVIHPSVDNVNIQYANVSAVPEPAMSLFYGAALLSLVLRRNRS